jgi:hypothetical protein
MKIRSVVLELLRADTQRFQEALHSCLYAQGFMVNYEVYHHDSVTALNTMR